MRHFVLVILCACLVCRVVPDSHPNRITSTKCRINTVVSPDDGHIFSRNMQRLIYSYILRINCAPSWLYLQDQNTDLGSTTPIRGSVIFEAVTVVTIWHLTARHLPEYLICYSQNSFHEVANGKINSVNSCFAIILTRLLLEILKTSAHNYIILAALCIGTRCVPLLLRQAYYCKMFDSRLSST